MKCIRTVDFQQDPFIIIGNTKLHKVREKSGGTVREIRTLSHFHTSGENNWDVHLQQDPSIYSQWQTKFREQEGEVGGKIRETHTFSLTFIIMICPMRITEKVAEKAVLSNVSALFDG